MEEKKDEPLQKKMLRYLSVSEQIDSLMFVLSLKGWVALVTTLMLITVVVTWSFLGNIPLLVLGPGIAMTREGTFSICSPVSGIVEQIDTAPGKWIKSGQTIAHIIPSDRNSPYNVTSLSSGQILEVYYQKGDWIQEGKSLAWVKSPLSPNETHVFYVFLPIDKGQLVQPGMKAEIALDEVNKEKYGYLKATVIDVAEFPASDQALLQKIPNPQIISLLKQNASSVVSVTLEPELDSQTVSGYRWTTRSGPPEFVHAGTVVEAKITIANRKPISYLLPQLFIQKEKKETINPDIFPTP